MARKAAALSFVILGLMVMLAGCGGDAVEKTGSVLTVNGRGFYESELEAMEQVTVTATHPRSGETAEYMGVSLLALLDDADFVGDTITVVAADGYETEIVVAEIPDTALVVIEKGDYSVLGYTPEPDKPASVVVSVEEDTFRLIMPDMGSSAWVKDVFEIR